MSTAPQAGFEGVFFERLAAIEDGHFWFEPRNKLLTRLAGRFFPDARSYLELGCGNGFVLRAMADDRDWDRITAIEPFAEGLDVARARLGDRATFIQSDAEGLAACQAIDLVGAFDVIEHIPDDARVLALIADRLTPGGGVILSVPQHRWLWSQADEVAHHVRRYARGELERKLTAAGLKPVFSGSYNAVLLPMMMVSRAMPGKAALQAEVRPHPAINAILKAAIHLETSLTLAGLRFPAGGSRVIAAIKM